MPPHNPPESATRRAANGSFDPLSAAHASLATICILLAACAGDPNPPGAANVALLLSDRTANGVYAGGGLFLANWHVCTRYERDDTLGPSDYVVAYNDPGDGSAPLDEGASLAGYYCLRADQHIVYAATPRINETERAGHASAL
jgi:hypothetical protein